MKDLLFIVLILACSAWAQTHTEFTLEDTQTVTAPKTFSNGGVFTNTQLNEYVKSLLNSCNTQTEIQATGVFGMGNATSAVSGCVAIPNGATAQSIGLASTPMAV